MAKRKLTHQQATRIRTSQRASAARVDENNATPEDDELGPEQPGLIIAHFGRQVDVEILSGERTGEIQRCHLRTNIEALVTGDRIVWRERSKGNGVIVANLPRRSLLSRPDVHLLQPKPVAANVDRIVVVVAPEPQPFANLIDRYLVAADATGITPLLLLNKSDLLDPLRHADIDPLLERYRRIGYTVLRASTVDAHGLDPLREQLCDRTSVFVGQSGVGKSSLIRALIPGVEIRIGDLSAVENKGRHTTTTAKLFHLPDGGDLIDSPGIREFGLDHLDRAQIEQGFVEFQEWLGRCKFRDCRHDREPGCALREALAQGQIDPERMRSFLTIVNQGE